MSTRTRARKGASVTTDLTTVPAVAEAEAEHRAEVAAKVAATVAEAERIAAAELDKIADKTFDDVTPQDVTLATEAEVKAATKRLKTYAAAAVKLGGIACADILLVTRAVPVAEFEAVTAWMVDHRFGRILPVLDRQTIAKAWDNPARVGGAVERKTIAKVLGVSPSLITSDLKEDGSASDKTTEDKLKAADTALERALKDKPALSKIAEAHLRSMRAKIADALGE